MFDNLLKNYDEKRLMVNDETKFLNYIQYKVSNMNINFLFLKYQTTGKSSSTVEYWYMETIILISLLVPAILNDKDYKKIQVYFDKEWIRQNGSMNIGTVTLKAGQGISLVKRVTTQ